MMIELVHGSIQAIDKVCLREMLFLQMWRLAGQLILFPNHIQRSVRHISWKPLAQGAMALSWMSPREWFVVERLTSLWLLADVDEGLLRLGITKGVSR